MNLKDAKDIILESIFNNAQVGIVVSNDERIITHINPEFTRIFGFTAEDAIGRKIKELFVPEEVYEEYDKMGRLLDKEDKIEYEIIRYRKDGSKIPVLCRVSMIINNGKRVGGFAIYSDISESKGYQEELLKAKKELKERVKARTDELERANRELRESEQRYRTAIENSHDGRNLAKSF
ncbi:MAG: PAS domain S-box protein [Deltaproteobacteria bacterium]|nr:MAG: PAS domain S-box protein [Deltaproteobacteria bacterium]